MRFNGLRWPLLLLVSIAAASGADNGKTKFEARAAADYPHRQTSEKVTIAAQPFVTDEQAHEAFGKINPVPPGRPAGIDRDPEWRSGRRPHRSREDVLQSARRQPCRSHPRAGREIHPRREGARHRPGPFGGIQARRLKNGPWRNGKSKGAHWPRRCCPRASRPAALSIFRCRW